MSRGSNLYPEVLTLRYGEIVMHLDVPEGVWNPTPHGNLLAQMILTLDFEGCDVLELGSGCGNHTVLIAHRNPKSLTVTEISQHILDNTKHNLAKNLVALPVQYLIADWTHLDVGLFDVLITNPPFAKSGKRYYRYFIDTLINDAHKLLRPGGRLIFVQSSMADFHRSEGLMNEWGMEVRVVGSSSGPFRDYYFEDEVFMSNIEKFPGAYKMVDGKHHETLQVYEARLPEL